MGACCLLCAVPECLEQLDILPGDAQPRHLTARWKVLVAAEQTRAFQNGLGCHHTVTARKCQASLDVRRAANTTVRDNRNGEALSRVGSPMEARFKSYTYVFQKPDCFPVTRPDCLFVLLFCAPVHGKEFATGALQLQAEVKGVLQVWQQPNFTSDRNLKV